MKIKNINLSLLVLLCLFTLSFSFYVGAETTDTKSIFLDSDQDGLSDEEEKVYGTNPHLTDTDGDGYGDGVEIKSGYNPLIPAPEDRIVETTPNISTEAEPREDSDNNLTKKVAEKITEIAKTSSSEDQAVTLQETEDMINDLLASSSAVDEELLPEIKREDIKIMKQDYDKYGEKRALEKKRDDFTNYLIAIYYILSSNSPKPITSGSNITNFFSTMTNQFILAISTGNMSSMKDLITSSEKILEQMKEVEVPEAQVELHIKGLRFAYYAISMKDDFETNTDDPLSQIASLNKIQALMGELTGYSLEIASQFNQYGLEYNDEVKNKLKDIGLFAPNEEDLKENSDDSQSN